MYLLPSTFISAREHITLSISPESVFPQFLRVVHNPSKMIPVAVGHPRSDQDVHMVPELFGDIIEPGCLAPSESDCPLRSLGCGEKEKCDDVKMSRR